VRERESFIRTISIQEEEEEEEEELFVFSGYYRGTQGARVKLTARHSSLTVKCVRSGSVVFWRD